MSLRFIQLAALLAAALTLLLLIATAAPSMWAATPLSGYMLMAHTSVTPVFVIAMLVVFYLSSPRLLEEQSATRKITASLIYLLALLSTFATAAIIPLTMLPIFSTDRLEAALVLHQRGGIVMAASVALYIIGVFISRSRLFEE